MTDTYLLEETVEVAAPPVAVWALVSDLPRMARWSPQVAKTVVRGGHVRLGAQTLNVNRRGLLVWPTRAKVVRFEPHREIAFRIKDNATIWSLTLEPTADGGTRVVQRREAPDGIKPISTKLVNAFMGGTESFTAELREGMRTTLARIKAEVEADTRADAGA
ncbi:SRPBCC family protein [Nocardioides perillae]|uniref:Uncharacterized protein YndB with AHSA1/START domain n=1 Tax=Nocardioides perillae TaxID=1119534 RepID=A0A7Y9UR96_9ACTN|nr:SRPBCC family protein [Nocardioides perillae]NYG54149.1 uncharacterized protein YndB with AHSA1/START domain [Nocardioides perillae]